MKITNKYSLPEGLVSVVENMVHPPTKDRFSVTQLIGPPLIRTLQLEKWDDIETDISDYMWMLLGIGVDNLINTATDVGSIRQHKMERGFGKYTVVGVLDVTKGDTIADWKCTSAYPFKIGEVPKDEWVEQLNVYDYLLSREENSLDITKLKIYAILRDWHKYETLKSPEYPKLPFQIVDIEQWSREQQEAYIAARLSDHNSNPYRECTDDEKWKSTTTYAVKTKGKARAERVLDTKEEAEQWMTTKKKGDHIEIRSGVCKRCEEYCPVRSICKYA